MTFTYAVSFESDIHPVETLRGTVNGEDAAEAIRRAVYKAEIARAGKTRFRSLAVVVEAVSKTATETPNKTKGVHSTRP